jgi:hypothetical protein
MEADPRAAQALSPRKRRRERLWNEAMETEK